MQIGMNGKSPFQSYYPAHPYLNLCKSTDQWWPSGCTDADWYAVLDANGYPTSLPAGFTFAEIIPYAGPEYGPAGRYVFLYDGNGTFTGKRGTTYNASASVAGRLMFDHSGAADLSIAITALGSPLPTNFRIVYSPDSTGGSEGTHIGVREALLNSGEIFDPDYVNKINPFKVFRFMQSMATNGSNQQNWSDRPSASWFSWCDIYKYNNVVGAAEPLVGGSIIPIEVAVALANKLNTDAWFCMPLCSTNNGGSSVVASNNYVASFADLVHQGNPSAPAGLTSGLNANLNVYVEYGNENWLQNVKPPEIKTTWNNLALSVLPLSGSGHDACFEYSTLRSVQDCKIWKDVWTAYGDGSRVKRVLGSAAGNGGGSLYWQLHTTCDGRTPGAGTIDLVHNEGYAGTQFTGFANSHFDIVAVGAYYYGIDYGLVVDNYYQFPSSWANAVPGVGLENAFTELLTGGVLPTTNLGNTTTSGATAGKNYLLTVSQTITARPADMTIVACQIHTTNTFDTAGGLDLAVNNGTAFPIVYKYNTNFQVGWGTAGRNCAFCFNNASSSWEFVNLAYSGGIAAQTLAGVSADVTMTHTANAALDVVIYEGGNNFLSGGITQYATIFNAMMNDPRLRTFYAEKFLPGLRDNGVSLYIHYADMMEYGRGGQWFSALPDQVSGTNFQTYQGLLGFIPRFITNSLVYRLGGLHS